MKALKGGLSNGMDKPGILDEVFEQGGQVVKKTAKQIAGAPKSAVKTAVSQVAPSLTQTNQPQEAVEDSPDLKKQGQNQQKPQQKPTSNLSQQLKPDPAKAAEEQATLSKVRQELHANYYRNLVNRPKPKDERAAEKVEKEEKEEEQVEFAKEQKKKKEDLALANVRRGTAETLKGIGG